MNYFQNGHGDGIIVLFLAVLSAGFTLLKRYQPLWFTGTGALGILLFTLFTLVFRISGMRSEVQREMSGNPFAGLGELAVQSIQIQWGWSVLLIGATLLIATAAWEGDEPSRSAVRTKLVAALSVLVVVTGISYLISRRGGESPKSVTASTGPSKEDVEEKGYLPSVKLYEASGGYSYGRITCPEYEGRKCASFGGKIKNEGGRTLREVGVTVYFPDKSGKTIFEKTYTPVLASSTASLFEGNSDPLKPGYVREFGYVVDDCPSECVPKKARIEVTNVEFAGQSEDADGTQK
ncbi:MAG: hypothetical protein ACHP8A_11160 [Terriglobales bacterium]|jgi:hypothetical protein|nr:hypothetical protein [Terriglobales bacterium]